MAHVVVLVGAPGSGKDTWALEEATSPHNDSDYEIVSSDDIRLELFGEYAQDKNDVVFNEMLVRTKELLTEGKNVIYNATNINRKRRASLYKEVKRIDKVKVGICLFTVPLGELLRRNISRPEDKKVPEEVIRRMYVHTDIPRVGVDCDTFMLAGHKYFRDMTGVEIEGLETIINLVKDPDVAEEIYLNYDSHDTPYHLETIDEHIDIAVENSETQAMKIIALFHDLGKGMVKNGGTYYGHEKLGAVYALNALYYSIESTRSVFELELPEVIFQHMNGNRGLTEKTIRNNNLTPELVKAINMFSEIDSRSRVV